MHKNLLIGYGLFLFVIIGCSSGLKDNIMINKKDKNELTAVLESHPEFFQGILEHKDEWNVQIIYSQINRDKNNQPTFTDYYFNVDDNRYFYPASTVKFPVAVLALQKLNELNIAGVDINSVMITGADGDGQTAVNVDSTSQNHKPSIAQYIKKILLVSDNDAFNRLYEFLGQEYINKTLHRMGYPDVQIIHRLDVSLTENQNRHTNPIKFYNSEGKLIYEKPAERSQLKYNIRNVKLGKGYMRGDSLVNEPFDFSLKNRLSLADLHNIMRSVLFPTSVPTKKRFNLTDADRQFLLRYMSMTPPESRHPAYDTSFHSAYAKFLFYGSEHGKPEPDIRIFNKVGDAYGFLRDVAYIADFRNGVEFMVSAVIYCNSDGILNDDKYDYDRIGLPFMKQLGRVLYDHELERQRPVEPDLSTFKFNYQD